MSFKLTKMKFKVIVVKYEIWNEFNLWVDNYRKIRTFTLVDSLIKADISN